MRYLITGGCGFIGVNLIRHLLKMEGSLVRVVDNLSVGKREDLRLVSEFAEISPANIMECPAHRLELIAGDIRDEQLAEASCRGIEAVIHLAANTGVIPSIQDPRADCLSNVLGTFNYLDASRMNDVKRFVLASSGAPLGAQIPPIHEEMVPHPISPYGASKLCGEAYCSAYHGSFGLDTVALRFGNVYGPYSSHKGSVVAKFIKHVLAKEPLTIYGDGNQTRDFVFVEDLASAILAALEKPARRSQVFQIATHQEHTVGEVAEELNSMAQRHLGRTSKVIYEKERKGEVRRNYSNITKARQMLGFEPKHDLKQGLEKTFMWFLERCKE